MDVINTEFEFPYGNSVLKANVPAKNISAVLKSQHIRGLENPYEAILSSLRNPIGRPSLAEYVHPGDRVAIIVTDNTRACPDSIIVPPILAEIERKTAPENITIIVALGLHPPLSREQLVEKLGSQIVSRYRVINHDASQTINLGVTSRGVPVEISRQVMEADFRISTGFIEPHFFAGFSGGCKSIFPGVAGTRAIHVNHGFGFIDDPNSKVGITEGNPIYQDMIEQAKIAKLDFIVNVVLNDQKEITHVICGEPVQAHQLGCKIVEDIAGVKVERKMDITITTNNGAPLDLDLYQTVKGIDNASMITRKGGIIIIAAACTSGAGPEEFRRLHSEAGSAQAVLSRIKAEEPLGVQWQNQILARAQMINEIYLISRLEDSLVREMGIKPVSSIEAGLSNAFETLGQDATVAVIPEGPVVFPILSDQNLL